jgi:hypothetical protein
MRGRVLPGSVTPSVLLLSRELDPSGKRGTLRPRLFFVRFGTGLTGAFWMGVRLFLLVVVVVVVVVAERGEGERQTDGGEEGE